MHNLLTKAKEIKQISDMNKDLLLEALTSAKTTRKKVRAKIKTNALDKVPKFINDAFDSKQAS